MKKLLFLISFIFVALIVNAQENADYDYKIGYDGTWSTFTATSNTTTATDSVWYYTFLKESKSPLFYDVKLSLDSVGGTVKRTTVILQSKKYYGDSYTNVQTKYWVTGEDTTITFTNVAAKTLSGSFEADSSMVFTGLTPKIDRYYRVFIRNDTKGFITKVTELSILFKEQ
jgi:hypothetical protein